MKAYMYFSLSSFLYVFSFTAKGFAFAISEIKQMEASCQVAILVMTVFVFLDYIKFYNLE